MSIYIDPCKGCSYLGWEDEGGGEGWPVCLHPAAQDEDRHADPIPAICVEACPVRRWRRVNGVPILCDQTTLGAY
jgi:hypothetical protein